MKYCTKCSTTKETSKFSKHKNRSDGLNGWCKECVNVSTAQHRINNRELLRLQSKEYRKNNKQKLKDFHCGVKRKYHVLKTCASRRNISVSITIEQYENIIKSRVCYYCDVDISNMSGSGLDRKDNNVGYTIDNVVQCCKTCNTIKMNHTVEELKKRLLKMYYKL